MGGIEKMSNEVLQRKAVSALGPDEAGQVLTAYLNTGPAIAQSHTAPAAAAQQQAPATGGVKNPS